MSAQRAVDLTAVSGSGGLDFETFFEAESRRLGKTMYLLTGDRAEAEDLSQEAFVRVYERWSRVRRMDSPGGYLYRTALNLHRKRLRRIRRWRPEPPAASMPDPAAQVEARAEVVRLLRAVSAEQREALVLVQWLGLSAEEAGRLLGIEAASVRGRVHRAREALRVLREPEANDG